MKLADLQRQWDKFGSSDPLWGILAWPDKAGQRWQIDEFFQTGREEIEEVMRYLAGLPLALEQGRALDFGCGVGRLTQALAAHFQQVDGVDISPAMLDLARQYNEWGERCRYHLNAADDLRLFEDERFDFIYSSITLQHMAPRYSRRYLAEFLRLLRPAGVLLFQLPAEPRQRWRRLVQPLKSHALFRLYQRLRYGERPIMEMYGLPRAEVRRILQQHGGRLLDVQPDTSADAHWTSYRYCVVKG